MARTWRSSSEQAAGAIALVSTLAFMGGYADTYSYLVAATFTGHVTGNAILAAIACVHGQLRAFGMHVLAVCLFLAGTEMGLQLLQVFAKRKAFIVAMVAEAALVLIAPVPTLEHWTSSFSWLIVSLCLAMGMQNGIFNKSLGVPLHTNFITGSTTSLLVRFTSKKIADASIPQNDNAATGLLSVLTAAFVAGALVAALASRVFGVRAVWLLEPPFAIALLLGGRQMKTDDA